MATKKEGAQRILDAHASSKTVRRRLLPVAIGIVLVGAAVTALTSWHLDWPPSSFVGCSCSTLLNA